MTNEHLTLLALMLTVANMAGLGLNYLLKLQIRADLNEKLERFGERIENKYRDQQSCNYRMAGVEHRIESTELRLIRLEHAPEAE